MSGASPLIADHRLSELLLRFGRDFDRQAMDLEHYYGPDFSAVIGDEGVSRTAYLASVVAMYGAGARDIHFEIDLCRALNSELLLASGTTLVKDADGAQHASRFTIVCGGTPLQFLHVHSSPARLAT
jgi:hypothetical protein